MLKYLSSLLVLCFFLNVHAQTIQIVAAENFYGKVAEQLGGPYVHVTSLISNPQQDPHLFSTTPLVAKNIANADIIIYNGLGYDDWIHNLIASSAHSGNQILVVGEIMKRAPGSNPHIWYDPSTMPTYASALCDKLSQLDSSHRGYFLQQLALFKKRDQLLLDQIAKIKKQFPGTPVIATEPVFNDMAQALSFKIYGLDFQISIMNDTEPSVSATKQFEDRITHRDVKILFYNNQVDSPLTERMRKLAKLAHIPIIGVSETEPNNLDYVSWMSSQLNDVEQALK
jgi:zinc/manganese transport system substrate-binding protein